jgi:hypothetical protein
VFLVIRYLPTKLQGREIFYFENGSSKFFLDVGTYNIIVQSRSVFSPEDGNSMLLRNVCICLPDYVASPPRKLQFLSVRTANLLPQEIYSVECNYRAQHPQVPFYAVVYVRTRFLSFIYFPCVAENGVVLTSAVNLRGSLMVQHIYRTSLITLPIYCSVVWFPHEWTMA